MFVDGINQNAPHGAEILMKKRWYVVFSQEPVFITTDTPVTVVNPHRNVFGLATPGTEIFFPLSPTRVLVMDDRHDQPKGLYYPLLDDSTGSALFNPAAWHHSERFMISSRHTHAVCAELLACAEGHDESPDTSALPIMLMGAPMKRDMDLVRDIFMKVEELPYDGGFHKISIEGRPDDEIAYHVMLAEARRDRLEAQAPDLRRA